MHALRSWHANVLVPCNIRRTAVAQCAAAHSRCALSRGSGLYRTRHLALLLCCRGQVECCTPRATFSCCTVCISCTFDMMRCTLHAARCIGSRSCALHKVLLPSRAGGAAALPPRMAARTASAQAAVELPVRPHVRLAPTEPHTRTRPLRLRKFRGRLRGSFHSRSGRRRWDVSVADALCADFNAEPIVSVPLLTCALQPTRRDYRIRSISARG